jgi:serine protease inhibitor
MEFNEKGTEAAAATIVKISKRSLAPEPLEIKLNRPFIYFITESSNNMIIFCGSFNGLSNTIAEENLSQSKTEL